MRWPWQKRCKDECQFAIYYTGYMWEKNPELHWLRCSRVFDHTDQHGHGSQFRWDDSTLRTVRERLHEITLTQE